MTKQEAQAYYAAYAELDTAAEAFYDAAHKMAQLLPSEANALYALCDAVNMQLVAVDVDLRLADLVVGEHVEPAAEQRAPHRAHATEDQHEEHEQAERHAEALGRDGALPVREQGAGDGREERAEHEHRDAIGQRW